MHLWLGTYNGPPTWRIERRRDVRGFILMLGRRALVLNAGRRR